MHSTLRITLAALLLVVPATASAMEQTVWDFRGGNLPGSNWNVAGMQAPATTAEGLKILADAEGTIITDVPPMHPIEVVSLTILSASATEARLLWHNAETPPGAFVQLPFIIEGGSAPRSIAINVDAYPQWDRHPDRIGIALPAGAQIVVQDIRFMRWNVLEKITEMWRGFWTFDRFSPISINFLWGPLLTFNPIATGELFTTLPPRGNSANWIFLGILLASGAGLLIHRMMRGHGRQWVHFLMIFAVLFLLYDIRMGLEFLSYAKTDVQTWLSQPLGQRLYRSYLDLPDVVDRSLPHVAGQKHFAVLTRPGIPLVAMMRYFAYPAIPVAPEGTSDLRTWIMYERPDVRVDDEGRLSIAGNPVSKPGKIVGQFSDTAFIFQTAQNP